MLRIRDEKVRVHTMYSKFWNLSKCSVEKGVLKMR